MYSIKGKKLTREQGFKLVEEFKKSGLKAPIYCEQQNVNICVLRYWRSIARQLSIQRKEGDLIPVKLIPSALSMNTLKVTLQGSIMIDIPIETDMLCLRKILEVCQDVVNR